GGGGGVAGGEGGGGGTGGKAGGGPAAVRGDAQPPRATGESREGGGRGSPESEDLPLAWQPNPSRKEDSCTDALSWPPSWRRSSSSRLPLRRGCTFASRARRRRSSAPPSRPSTLRRPPSTR